MKTSWNNLVLLKNSHISLLSWKRSITRLRSKVFSLEKTLSLILFLRRARFFWGGRRLVKLNHTLSLNSWTYEKYICQKNNLVQKILGPKNIYKKFWVNKIWVQKNHGSEIILGPKNIMGPKKLWVKIFESEKYFESNIFGLPPFPTAKGKVRWVG